jgi:hypothetical protein
MFKFEAEVDVMLFGLKFMDFMAIDNLSKNEKKHNKDFIHLNLAKQSTVMRQS